MSGPPSEGPVRVVLACSGLDHAHRGFESFARECFEVLGSASEIDLELVKGSGRSGPHERTARSLRRDSRVARLLSRASGKQPFRFEQLAFGLSLQPALNKLQPDVVYFSEWHTGVALAALRRVIRQRYALVLSNGTLAIEGFDHLDRVHEHTQPALDAVLKRGATPARHVLLPVGFRMEPEPPTLAPDEIAPLRRRLDLPVDRPIVISVAAINRHHKRMDYLVEEIARMPEPRPFLLLVGAMEDESAGIERLAADRLESDAYSIRTVPRREIDLYLLAADAFVLASLGEGLPRALVEAAAAGLPCFVHDYGVTHYALGPNGFFADFTQAGALANLLSARDDLALRDPQAIAARHRYVYDRFSWEQLREEYVELLVSAPRYVLAH